jgi:pimeloyl-ACP methyl ester carboxylesterase
MATFGLVHGAYHGGWCWSRVVAGLEARGHRALTVDLPCEDPAAGALEYAVAAAEAFAGAGDDLVVVGHSLAGLTIPLLPSQLPVRHLVYLCAMLPEPGRTLDEVMAEQPDMVLDPPMSGATRDADGVVRWPPEAAAAWFFADCTPDDAAWAAAQLRGQAWAIAGERWSLDAWPDVPTTYVLGRHDTVIGPAWSRRIVPHALGVEPIELDAGHSPFLACPDVLVDHLVRAVSA